MHSVNDSHLKKIDMLLNQGDVTAQNDYREKHLFISLQ